MRWRWQRSLRLRRPRASNYRTVTLNSDRRGHFQIEVRVDGRTIEFLVDTGASSSR